MKKNRILALALTGILAATAAAPMAVFAESEDHDPVSLRFMWWGGDERNEATGESHRHLPGKISVDHH